MKSLTWGVMPQAPCKDCVPPKRHSGCHGDCEEYKAYKDKSEEMQNQIKEQKSFERTFYAAKRDVCTRVLKNKKGK